MELEIWFRVFFRKTYPEVEEITLEEIDELGVDFDKYMRDKFDEDKLSKLYPTDASTLIMDSLKLFTHHGFSLGLAINFFEYVKQSAKSYEDYQNNNTEENI
jgi:hypothetical protein